MVRLPDPVSAEAIVSVSPVFAASTESAVTATPLAWATDTDAVSYAFSVPPLNLNGSCESRIAMPKEPISKTPFGRISMNVFVLSLLPRLSSISPFVFNVAVVSPPPMESLAFPSRAKYMDPLTPETAVSEPLRRLYVTVLGQCANSTGATVVGEAAVMSPSPVTVIAPPLWLNTWTGLPLSLPLTNRAAVILAPSTKSRFSAFANSMPLAPVLIVAA